MTVVKVIVISSSIALIESFYKEYNRDEESPYVVELVAYFFTVVLQSELFLVEEFCYPYHGV